MKYKTTQIFITATIVSGLLLGVALPAFAQTETSSTRAAARQAALITRAQGRADQEIARRVAALNVLNTRIQAMQKLSADEKTSLASAIQAQLTELATLKTKIDADTDATTLKTDIQ